jgi:hypothetical protein
VEFLFFLFRVMSFIIAFYLHCLLFFLFLCHFRLSRKALLWGSSERSRLQIIYTNASIHARMAMGMGMEVPLITRLGGRFLAGQAGRHDGLFASFFSSLALFGVHAG